MSQLKCVLFGALFVAVVPANVAAIEVAPPQDATRLTLTVEPQLIRFSTPAGDVLDWRLQIVNAHNQQIYDSELVAGRALTWTLVDSQGQGIDSGIYSYTLSVRGAGRPRNRQGQLLVQKTANGYQVWAMSDTQAALAGDGETILTVTAGEAASTEAASPASANEPAPAGSALPTNMGRALFGEVGGYISGTGTTNSMTKWSNGPTGVVSDANVTEVNGDVVVGNVSNNGNLQIYGASNNDVFAGMGPNIATGPAFNFGYAGASFGRSAGFFNVRPDASASPPNPSLRFMTANVQRAIITNSGDVGIGIDAPTIGRLQVVGADSSGGHVSVGADVTSLSRRIVSFGDNNCVPIAECVYIGEEDQDDRLVMRFGQGGMRLKSVNATNSVLPDADNAIHLGGASNRWIDVYAVNGSIQTSDARLKTNIKTLSYGLGELMKLRPVAFDWKDHVDNRRHVGLLAQDVEKIIPEAVYHDSTPDAPLGMNYTDLVPVVIKAVQEQQTIIDRKSSELEAVKIDNAALRERVAALELLVRQLVKKIQ